MTNRSDEADPPRDIAFSAIFALMVTAMACAIFLCAVPRAVPFELPVLRLDEPQVRAQIAQDRRLSEDLRVTELTQALYRALRDAGESELTRDEARAFALERRIDTLHERAQRELKADGMRAVRAHATERSMLALSAQLDDEQEERELIGTQRTLFAAYGYTTREGNPLAPELTMRAMIKVRWNMIFRLPNTEGLSAIERQAYEGYRALEAENIPAGLRVEALHELIRAGGGLRAERALAILQAMNGRGGPLVARVQGSADEAAQIRLRNMALAALPEPDAM